MVAILALVTLLSHSLALRLQVQHLDQQEQARWLRHLGLRQDCSQMGLQQLVHLKQAYLMGQQADQHQVQQERVVLTVDAQVVLVLAPPLLLVVMVVHLGL
jgi:hypothetical protein